MTLCLVLGVSSVSVWAAEVGEQLLQPETGWLRYDADGTDSKFIRTGTWVDAPGTGCYNSTYKWTKVQGSTVKFKFWGTKLRLIEGWAAPDHTEIAELIIDGKTEVVNTNSSICRGNKTSQVIIYENLNLKQSVHVVELRLVENKYMDLDAIELDENAILLDFNQTAKLSVLLNVDENVQLSTSYDLDNNKNFTWASTNESVATVDSNGKVTAVGVGDADIYAQNEDGTFKEYIPVRVVEGIADELRLAVHLKSGEKAKLYLTDDPSQVTWNSMDDSTVTVSADGQVTGVKKGLAIVQAELDGQKYQIYVRVNG